MSNVIDSRHLKCICYMLKDAAELAELEAKFTRDDVTKKFETGRCVALLNARDHAEKLSSFGPVDCDELHRIISSSKSLCTADNWFDKGRANGYHESHVIIYRAMRMA